MEAVKELVGCWSQLEGKIDELTKWVDASKSSDPGAQAGLSIDKLEEQLKMYPLRRALAILDAAGNVHAKTMADIVRQVIFYF